MVSGASSGLDALAPPALTKASSTAVPLRKREEVLDGSAVVAASSVKDQTRTDEQIGAKTVYLDSKNEFQVEDSVGKFYHPSITCDLFSSIFHPFLRRASRSCCPRQSFNRLCLAG